MQLTQQIDSIRHSLTSDDGISPKAEIRQSTIGGKDLFAISPNGGNI